MGRQYQEIVQELATDFPLYAKNCLFIKTKNGKIIPLELNKAQLHIHHKIEEQKAKIGKVRAIVLKGRQQGCSTMVQGRYIHLTTLSKGVQAFVLANEDESTKNIFSMAKRYYENIPIHMKPSLQASNDKSLRFGKLDSGWKVGTAGNKSVGRSMTNQLFHGSEVAFWPNAQEHAKGILQTISDEEGTEIILESTANGVGGFFHEQWKKAESGESEYIAIFVPWFWQEEYRKAVPDDFKLTDDEEKVAGHYGLDLAQMCWRRNKIADLSSGGFNGLKGFKQEYPNNAAEAFQVSGEDGLIKPDSVMAARKADVSASGHLIVGVDPSRGGDRFTTIKRGRRKAYDHHAYTGTQVDKLGKAVSICKTILDTVCPVMGKKPDMMFIDAGGGADLVDRLHELGYEDRVKAIHFGGQALDPDKYTNRRNEMWDSIREWLEDESMQVDLVDCDEVHADLCASPFDRDSHDRVVLWRKEKIKKEYGFSPDYGDALGLTFAEPIVEKKPRKKIKSVSPW